MTSPNGSNYPDDNAPNNNRSMMNYQNYTPHLRQLTIQIPIPIPDLNDLLRNATGTMGSQNYSPLPGHMLIQIPVTIPLPPMPIARYVYPGTSVVNFTAPRNNVPMVNLRNYPPYPRPATLQFPIPSTSSHRFIFPIQPETSIRQEIQPPVVDPIRGCGFCRSLGYPSLVYNSHNLRNNFGELICRTLLDYKCKKCDQLGHTEVYCDQKPKDRPN